MLRREDLTAPFVISDTEAQEIAASYARLNGKPESRDEIYNQFIDGDATLYEFNVVVR